MVAFGSKCPSHCLCLDALLSVLFLLLSQSLHRCSAIIQLPPRPPRQPYSEVLLPLPLFTDATRAKELIAAAVTGTSALDADINGPDLAIVHLSSLSRHRNQEETACPLFSPVSSEDATISACTHVDFLPPVGGAGPGAGAPLLSPAQQFASASLSLFTAQYCPDEKWWALATRVLPSQCGASAMLRSLNQFEQLWTREKMQAEYVCLPRDGLLSMGVEGRAAAQQGGAAQQSPGVEGREGSGGTTGWDALSWAPQLFLLRNMWVDRWGRVFNRTHLFHAGRCSDVVTALNFSSGTRVAAMEHLAVLLADAGDGAHSDVAEALPLLLPLQALLREKGALPVLLQDKKRQQQLLSALLDLHVNHPPVFQLHHDQLLRVKHLYVPLFQPCGHASPSLWHALRSRALLPPQGLPLLASPLFPAPPGAFPLAPALPSSHLPLSPAWLVVVAGPSSRVAREQPLAFRALAAAAAAAQQQLREIFGAQRVVLYDPRESMIDKRVQLFRRTLLLVACDHHSLAHLVWMPFVSAVLEIHLALPQPATPPPPASAPHPLFARSPLFHAAESGPYAELAAAAGVRHYLLNVTTALVAQGTLSGSIAGGGGSTSADWEEVGHHELQQGEQRQIELFGGSERLRLALEGVASELLSSDAFSAVLLSPPNTPLQKGTAGSQEGLHAQGSANSGMQRRIPGSQKVQSEAELAEYRQWQACVEREGRWERMAEPRRLGWEHGKDYCSDERLERVNVTEADAVAEEWAAYVSGHGRTGYGFEEQRKKAEAAWKVREASRYEWRANETCGQWLSLNSSQLCSLAQTQADGSRRLFVLVVGDSLNAQVAQSLVGELYRHSNATDSTNRGLPEKCDYFNVKHHYCEVDDYRFAFCPNTVFSIEYVRNDYLLLSNHPQELPFTAMRWSRMRVALRVANVIVFNRGLHMTTDKAFRKGIRAALRFVRVLEPEKLIVVRSSAQGHKKCEEFKAPVAVPQSQEGLPFGWEFIPEQNEIAKEEAHAAGAVFMDVVPMTQLRPDGHLLPNFDCLHYCIPGPTDGWAQLLLNILFKLL